MKLHTKILGIMFLYCAIFAWMSVPFVTTEKAMLRKQVMFIDGLQDSIAEDATLASAEINPLGR